jgi:LPS-assembly protein
VRRLLALLACCTSVAWAADAPALRPLSGCPVDAAPDWGELPPLDAGDERIEVLAGRADVDLNEGAVFSDGITIRRGAAVLRAPGARYDQATGEFSLDGGLQFGDADTAISGSGAVYEADSNAVSVKDAEFQLYAVPARGSARSITVLGQEKLTLRDVTYTTCARGNEDWLIRADKIEIDRTTGIGTARDARLEFKGVPILRTPWLSYPATNERKSGFLLPGLGRSETRGLEFQIPYYLNLAPNYDATLTPRYMAQRGLELISEFRYLWPEHGGELAAEYLPNDKGTGDNRYLFGWDHTSQVGDWRARLNGRTVSDTRYFEDLSGSSAATSQTHLERLVDIEYYDEIWSVLLRFQDFETLDESLSATEKPYRRVPQLAASAALPRWYGLDLRFDSELSVFERNASTTGSRLHLAPAVSWPISWRGFELEPAVVLDHTMYSVDNPAPGEDDGPSRTAPIWSVDLKSVFERGYRGSAGVIQTLEPRIQYVAVPFRDQGDLPVFDTIEPDFNLVQLFRTNRFLGYDRLGDTNQLNFGLTTRILDAEDGTQYLTATVGQSRFFGRQRVTLPTGVTPTTTVEDKSSDWLAELDLAFARRWKLGLGYQWDADDSRTERAEARLQYRRDGRRVANLAYRYRRDRVDEIDVSAAWPLTERWSAVGRYNYSLFDPEEPVPLPPDEEPIDDSLIESFVGVEYQNCCWGLRLVYRRYLASRTGEFDNAIAVQLILKGLTNVGDPADRLLERGILGYETD